MRRAYREMITIPRNNDWPTSSWPCVKRSTLHTDLILELCHTVIVSRKRKVFGRSMRQSPGEVYGSFRTLDLCPRMSGWHVTR